MNESNHNELWQVEVSGQIYEAAFNELGEWIGDGSLLPDDKIRKGNLRWTQAKLVPSLVPFFNAKAAGEPMPVVQTTTSFIAKPAVIPSDVTPSLHGGTNTSANPLSDVIPPAADVSVEQKPIKLNTKVCLFHPELSSLYLCEGCGNGFCKSCPKSYGGTVKICPLCGQMCKAVGEVKPKQQQTAMSSTAVSEGFGAGDFLSALAYPFKFKVSLVLGAVMVMLLTLGRGAAGMGGIFMIVSGIFSGMAANALTFGVLSNTIDNFIQGKFDENFMPEFDDFELWGDVIHPFFLSIAAYISSFGPFLLVLAIGFYLVTSAVGDQMDAYKSDLERIPGTQVYAGRELADQSGDVKDVLKDVDQKQRERIAAATEFAEDYETSNTITQPVDEESRQQEELWAAANESRKKSLESAIGKMPETHEQEDAAMIKAFLGLAAPLVVIGFITFIWGLIFFPASCAVAGYSRSFVATINPLIGLDTIKRLGVDYIKILAMGFVLLVFSLVVGVILGAIFTAFDMPLVGNIPATALGAIFTFYLMAVFSCILGYALFKSADKLGLAR